MQTEQVAASSSTQAQLCPRQLQGRWTPGAGTGETASSLSLLQKTKDRELEGLPERQGRQESGYRKKSVGGVPGCLGPSLASAV